MFQGKVRQGPLRVASPLGASGCAAGGRRWPAAWHPTSEVASDMFKPVGQLDGFGQSASAPGKSPVAPCATRASAYQNSGGPNFKQEGRPGESAASRPGGARTVTPGTIGPVFPGSSLEAVLGLLFPELSWFA